VNSQFLVVWSALAITQLVYLVIPIPAASDPASHTGLLPILPVILGTLAFGQAMAALGILRLRVFGPIRSGLLDPTTDDGARRLLPMLIIAWALAESIAIYGLVLRFMHYAPLHWVGSAAAAALVTFLGRPWQARFRPTSSAHLAQTGAPIH
jgi:F0F1-type ATP synthase membrane subunit c/vacuolar-type H+-ATPase subunit K